MKVLRLLPLLACLALPGPSAQAVLNERTLAQTLGVLADELAEMNRELDQMTATLDAFNALQHERLIQLMAQSDKTALVLYSQHEEYIFNVTYACQQATEQYATFLQERRPYDDNLAALDVRIARFDKLIASLRNLPPRSREEPPAGQESTAESLAADSLSARLDSLALAMDSLARQLPDSLAQQPLTGQTQTDKTGQASEPPTSDFLLTPEQQTKRDSCVTLAQTIRDGYAGIRDRVSDDLGNYQAIAEKLRALNDYAQERYQAIQKEIFEDGDTPFAAILANWRLYWRNACDDAAVKYSLTGLETEHSAWRGPIVLFFAFFALFYLAIAIVICNILFRWLMPKLVRKKSFEQTKNYLIVAASMLLFSLAMIVCRYTFANNFMRMACGLMIQFSLLTTAIVGSLLFRYKPEQIGYGFRIYLPVIVMGFLVILSRIILIPNSLANLAYPILLTGLTAWQLWAVRGNQHGIPPSDIVWAGASLAFVAISCVASWLGYSLIAIQIFTWWMMQLTCILGISCCYDALHLYEETRMRRRLIERCDDHKNIQAAMNAYKQHTGDFYKVTWLADLIRITILPVLATLSFPFCVAWATGIFNLTETFRNLLMTNFISIEDVCELSLFKILMVLSVYFVFRYINYLLKAIYRDVIRTRKVANGEANMTLANNIISIVCWGAFFIFALVLLKVPKSGISIVTAGLATGLGFAMKDVLNNFIYGLSLMTGRVRVGETIECDGIRGTVESITYQSTQIATIDGGIIAFLNSSLFNKNFKNLSRNHDYELLTVVVGVAYGSDADEVKELLTRTVQALVVPDPKTRKHNIDPNRPLAVRLTELADNSVNFTIVLWVRVGMKPVVTAQVYEAAYKALNAAGIGIPFPQRDIHIINDEAPAASAEDTGKQPEETKAQGAKDDPRP